MSEPDTKWQPKIYWSQFSFGALILVAVVSAFIQAVAISALDVEPSSTAADVLAWVIGVPTFLLLFTAVMMTPPDSVKCEKCGTKFKDGYFTCRKCGHTYTGPMSK